MNKIILFLIIGIVFVSGCQSLFIKIKPQEQIPVTAQVLLGFETECFENETVEKYELIEKDFDTLVDYCDYIFCTGELYTSCIWSSWSDCIIENEDTFSKNPFIRFWNETVCTKEILVRRLG